jgi:hypothetical protein
MLQTAQPPPFSLGDLLPAANTFLQQARLLDRPMQRGIYRIASGAPPISLILGKAH